MEKYKAYIKIENYENRRNSEFIEKIRKERYIEGTNFLNATSKLLTDIKKLPQIHSKKPGVKSSDAYISKVEKESENGKLSKIEGKIAKNSLETTN